MKETIKVETINEYNDVAGQQTLHPLVSVIDLNKAPRTIGAPVAKTVSFGFYAIFLKEDKNCIIRYGRNTYDYQQGTLVFIAPDQGVSILEDGDDYQPTGHVLLFHPDLITGTALSQHISKYTFFSYRVFEALHLSTEEKQIVMDCFAKIQYELGHAIDKHSKNLIVSNIELFLDYCTRFYDRQFITRDYAGRGTLDRFYLLLDEYFKSAQLAEQGIPTVSYCAANLHLSTNYFSDLIKKETGKGPQEHIHSKLVEVAKNNLVDHKKSISEIAYQLGFKYPQHFTRFFKMHTGVTPIEFRN